MIPSRIRKACWGICPAAFAALCLAAAPPAEAQTYQLNTLASFNGNGNGAVPQAGLTLSGSTLYGTTSSGGPSGGGTVFSIPTSGGTPNVLASFDSSANATTPESNLTLSTNGNTLYGTTLGFAGVDAASTMGGTVFSVPVTGATGGIANTLASFNANSSGQFANGANSSAGLVLSGTTLYGTTQFGGVASQGTDQGTIFSLPVAGGTPNVLYSFTAGVPQDGLLLSGGVLYGTTSVGGTGDGSVFSFNPTTLALGPTAANFNGAGNGLNPYAGLTLVGSTLYGTAQFGGANNDGTLFSIAVGGTTITPLVTFTSTVNGANPVGGLTLGANNTLYGTTSNGGANSGGTVFSFNIGTAKLTTLVSFTGGTDGGNPLGSITLGANGTIYGMTSAGGANGDGTIFSLTPTAAPEPSPWTIFGLGVLTLGALMLRARRKGKVSSENQ